MLGLAACLALTLWSVLSHSIAPTNVGGGRMVLLIGGGILIQQSPEVVELGFQMMDADIPSKGFGVRLRGWFMCPQRMGTSAWFIPFGPLVLLGTVLFWFLHWRARERSSSGLCKLCGYNLTGHNHVVCPECGADIERVTLPGA